MGFEPNDRLDHNLKGSGEFGLARESSTVGGAGIGEARFSSEREGVAGGSPAKPACLKPWHYESP
jgi:hypothetical protein